METPSSEETARLGLGGSGSGGGGGGPGRGRGVQSSLALGELELALLDGQRALSLLRRDLLAALGEIELHHRELELLALDLEVARGGVGERRHVVRVHRRERAGRRGRTRRRHLGVARGSGGGVHRAREGPIRS